MTKENKKTPPNYKGGFERFTESLGWLKIAASPTLVGLVIAAIIYFPNPTSTTLIIGLLVAILGLATGIVWATKHLKKNGTIDFSSRVMATPELDDHNETM